VLFRTRRRDECLELKEGLGRRVRKSRQNEAAGVCGGRGVIYGISIDFPRKASPEAEFGKKVVIDDHRSMHYTPVHDSPHRNPSLIILQASYPRISDGASLYDKVWRNDVLWEAWKQGLAQLFRLL
jgi:hypothetical protein